MKVMYEGKNLDISDLPEGKFLCKDRAVHSQWRVPVVNREEIGEVVVNYTAPEVRGPFNSEGITRLYQGN